MKKAKRWYENNRYLCAFMRILEDLDPNSQSEVALELMLEVLTLIDNDKEKFVKLNEQYDPKEHKRWYDSNPNLHASIEILKDLDDFDVSYLMNKISSTLLKYNKELEI